MLGTKMTDEERKYYAKLDEEIASLSSEQQLRLISVIKMVLDTFTEEESQGVLILIGKDRYLKTMGLNANFYETGAMLHAAYRIFSETAAASENEVRH